MEMDHKPTRAEIMVNEWQQQSWIREIGIKAVLPHLGARVKAKQMDAEKLTNAKRFGMPGGEPKSTPRRDQTLAAAKDFATSLRR